MDWPKQVRRGVTATLFMTTAAWVQSAGANPWPAADAANGGPTYSAYMASIPAPSVHTARVQVEPARPIWNYAASRFAADLPAATAAEPAPRVESQAFVSAEAVPAAPRMPVQPASSAPAESVVLVPSPVPAAAPRMVVVPSALANVGTEDRDRVERYIAANQPEALAGLMPAAGTVPATSVAIDAPATAVASTDRPGSDTLLVMPGVPNANPAAAMAAPAVPPAPAVVQPASSKALVKEALAKAKEIQNQRATEVPPAPPMPMAAAPSAPVAVSAAPAMPAAPVAAPVMMPPAAPTVTASAMPAPPMSVTATDTTGVPVSALPMPPALVSDASAPMNAPVPPAPVEMATAQTQPAPVSSALPSATGDAMDLPPVPGTPSSAGHAPQQTQPVTAAYKKSNKKKSEGVPVTAKAPVTTTDAVLGDQRRRFGEQARAAEAHAPISLSREAAGDARLQSQDGVRSHTGVGVSISVHKPTLDANYELNQAYQALGMGDANAATDIYKRVLEAQPRNTDALFGLATTYHRAGRLADAKQLYTTLLAVAPEHRDGLNNFLMLLGEENPDEALHRLHDLEAANPNYAPVPAQIAMIHQRQNDLPGAVDAMSRAVSRDPDNLAYRYNLAVLLDQAGNWNDAAGMYKEVLAAVDRGGKVPGTRDGIQQRLTYLMTRHVS